MLTHSTDIANTPSLSVHCNTFCIHYLDKDHSECTPRYVSAGLNLIPFTAAVFSKMTLLTKSFPCQHFLHLSLLVWTFQHCPWNFCCDRSVIRFWQIVEAPAFWANFWREGQTWYLIKPEWFQDFKQDQHYKVQCVMPAEINLQHAIKCN